MKKLFSLIALLPILFACNNEFEGNLVGVRNRKVFDTDLLGPGNLPIGTMWWFGI